MEGEDEKVSLKYYTRFTHHNGFLENCICVSTEYTFTCMVMRNTYAVFGNLIFQYLFWNHKREIKDKQEKKKTKWNIF